MALTQHWAAASSICQHELQLHKEYQLAERPIKMIKMLARKSFIIPAGSVQAYVNLKAYWEFDAHDRPSGWNAWLTLSLSPSAPTNPRSAMLTK